MLLIPRILHFVWIGDDPVPTKYSDNVGEWEKHHRDWDIRVWTEIPDDVEWRWVTLCERRPVMLADILRVEMVYRHGGVYADLDTWAVQSIEHLLDGVAAFVGRNRGGEIDNPIFGATAGNPWLRHTLGKVGLHYRPGIPFGLMGANLFCRTVPHHEVTIFDSEVLNAFPGDETERTAVVHSADGSWKKR
jgi:mannosyltransferase OCH1-like enzyme